MQRGDLIADRFEVERETGVGGMGTVYLARDHLRGGSVALKVLRGRSGRAVERFEREARLLAELDHPRIVGYVAHGVPRPGLMYLAMEWLEGEDLGERLARGPVPIDDAVRLAGHVAEALVVAHARGVIHRDIKPGNIFLVGGDLAQAKLLDFGVALLRYAPRATGTGIAVGTPGYMAPEQASGAREVDARADIFALGCLLYESVTGLPLFAGENVMAILAKIILEEAPRVADAVAVSPALDDLVARMLAKDPDARPPSARALLAELGALGASRPSVAPSSIRHVAALTGGERRFAPIVFVGPQARFDAATIAPSGEVDVAARDTLPGSEPGPAGPPDGVFFGVQALRDAAAAFDARVEPLLDGSAVVLLPEGGAATDRAARAAACALALRAASPLSPMALASGRTELASRLPVGDAIDRASRLLAGVAGDGDVRPIRIDDVTAGLLDARFDVVGDGAGLVLRGRREREAVRTLLGRPTPCVGRETELRQLEGLFQQSVEEPVARVAILTAPAGAGKSRLRHELVERLRARGEIEVWSAGGDPVAAGSPFGLASQLLRGAAGMLEGEPLAVRQRKLRARVGRHVAGAEVARVAEFLGEIAGAPFPDDERVPLRAARADAMMMGDQIRAAFQDLVAAECEASPLMIVLDDLQWGDLPTVKLLDAAMRSCRERPLFVLALARPEALDVFPRLWEQRDVVPIRLGALARRAGERLVRSALGADVAPPIVERLLDRAAGNAFYLEELIRAEAEGSGAALPETVLAMVEARLSAMEPEARRVLRAASVFGQVFWASGVRALLDGVQGAFTEANVWLDELVRREVVMRRGEGKFAGEEEYAFRQATVREAAHGMLTESDAALGHRLAADWLERAGATDAMALAEHLERGGERARAIGWYRRAAEQALDGNDFAAAIERVERGRQCGAEGEVLGALCLVEAQAHKWRGDAAPATAAIVARALSLLPRGSDAWCTAAGEMSNACMVIGDIEGLVAIGEELGEMLEGDGATAPLVAAVARTVVLLHMAGRYALGDAIDAAARRARTRLGLADPIVDAYIFATRAQRALVEGDPVAFLEATTSVARCFEAAGATRSACNRRCSVAYGFLELGAFARAERELVDVIAVADRMGLPAVAENARQNLGWAAFRQGRLAEARAILEANAAVFRAFGNRRMEGGSRDYLAAVLAAEGDLVGAEREAVMAVSMLEATPPLCAGATATLASVLLRSGRADEALVAARHAMAMLEHLGGIEEGDALVRLVLAESLQAMGEHAAARAQIEDAREKLLARASRIIDGAYRETFLESIPEHARTLALADGLGSAS